MDTLCESCFKLPFRYKCPKCDRKSCSLSCVKQHKVENGCDGVRSKTTFVPLSEFSDKHLLSDYYFLEDVNRYLECNERDPIRQLNREPKPKYQMSQKLKAEACRRGIAFVQLPCAFEKHKMNTSRVVKSKGPSRLQKIHWRVRWLFPQCDLEYLDTNVCEDEVVVTTLNKYIHPTSSDPVARHRLKAYVCAGVEEVKVFMKAEMTSAQTRYYILDINKSLGENLFQKTVVEFPELHVVLEKDSQPYIQQLVRVEASVSTVDEAPQDVEQEELPAESSEQHMVTAPAELSSSLPSLAMLAVSYAECTDSE